MTETVDRVKAAIEVARQDLENSGRVLSVSRLQIIAGCNFTTATLALRKLAEAGEIHPARWPGTWVRPEVA